MKKTVSCFILIAFTIALSAFSAGDAFSQTDSATVHTDEKNTGAYVSGLTPARVKSLIGVAFGLTSLIIGWRFRTKSGTNQRRTKRWTLAGLVSGILAVVLSVVHLAVNTGAFGTGGGKAGAIVALV